MKKLIASLATLGLAAAVGGCANTEPKVICNVGRGGALVAPTPFAMQFVQKPGAPTCGTTLSDLNSGSTAVSSGLNQFGLEAYVSDKDLSLNLVAIRPGEYAGFPVPKNDPSAPNPNALGTFTDFHPDANSLCTVPTLSAATQGAIAADPTTKPPSPAIPQSTYTFTNLKVLNDSSHAGTQFQVDMHYVDQAGCPSDYTAIGTWPAVPCDKTHGTSGNADCDPNGNNPNSSNINGSGIAADYPLVCSQGQCQVDISKGSFPYIGQGNYN